MSLDRAASDPSPARPAEASCPRPAGPPARRPPDGASCRRRGRHRAGRPGGGGAAPRPGRSVESPPDTACPPGGGGVLPWAVRPVSPQPPTGPAGPSSSPPRPPPSPTARASTSSPATAAVTPTRPRPRTPIVALGAGTWPRGLQALLAGPAGLLPAAGADAGPRRPPASRRRAGISPPLPSGACRLQQVARRRLRRRHATCHFRRRWARPSRPGSGGRRARRSGPLRPHGSPGGLAARRNNVVGRCAPGS